jgi:hypothetical protein
MQLPLCMSQGTSQVLCSSTGSPRNILALSTKPECLQAALDVFDEEPPKFSTSLLINRPEVICTPHLGASTTEAQEGVSIEVVEAVQDALAGRLTSNAVNAPMVPAEVLKELAPYVKLAECLGKAAVQLVQKQGFKDVQVRAQIGAHKQGTSQALCCSSTGYPCRVLF